MIGKSYEGDLDCYAPERRRRTFAGGLIVHGFALSCRYLGGGPLRVRPNSYDGFLST